VSWDIQAGKGDIKAFQEAMFTSMPANVEPENKRVSPCIPLQAGYRSKNKGLIHIWLHATLLATSSPELM
jgi:hypothetical protein